MDSNQSYVQVHGTMAHVPIEAEAHELLEANEIIVQINNIENKRRTYLSHHKNPLSVYYSWRLNVVLHPPPLQVDVIQIFHESESHADDAESRQWTHRREQDPDVIRVGAGPLLRIESNQVIPVLPHDALAPTVSVICC